MEYTYYYDGIDAYPPHNSGYIRKNFFLKYNFCVLFRTTELTPRKPLIAKNTITPRPGIY